MLNIQLQYVKWDYKPMGFHYGRSWYSYMDEHRRDSIHHSSVCDIKEWVYLSRVLKDGHKSLLNSANQLQAGVKMLWL